MYNVIRETPISNPIVKELNAAVLTSTFEIKEGIVKADLYRGVNRLSLVAHGSCRPTNSEFVKTIEIDFSSLA
jgi:hypothetical protein